MSALIISAFASLFILGVLDNLRGPFFPDILNDFSVNSSSGGIFFGLTSLFAVIGSFAGQKAAVRTSALHVLIGASMIFSAGFFVIGVAPTWTWACVGAALFGLAFGALNYSQNALVLESAPGHIRRQMMNGLHSMYGLAALAAPLTASLFRGLGCSWRLTYMIAALLPWILLLWIGQYVKRPVQHEERRSAIPLYRDEWRLALFFGLIVSGYMWGEISLTTRMVQWLRSDLGYGPTAANFLMGGFCASLLAGRILFSLIHFPMFTNWDILRFSSLGSAVTFALGVKIHPLFLILSGFTMAPFFPVAMDQINSTFGDKSSQALGFVISFSSLSIVVMHVAIGLATDAFGLSRTLLVFVGVLVLVYASLEYIARRTRVVGSSL